MALLPALWWGPQHLSQPNITLVRQIGACSQIGVGFTTLLGQSKLRGQFMALGILGGVRGSSGSHRHQGWLNHPQVGWLKHLDQSTKVERSFCQRIVWRNNGESPLDIAFLAGGCHGDHRYGSSAGEQGSCFQTKWLVLEFEGKYVTCFFLLQIFPLYFRMMLSRLFLN